MLATRLVFLEGIMGAGKSTTGQWLAREIATRDVDAQFVWEGPTAEYPEHPLRVAPGLPHPKAPWHDLSTDAYAELSLSKWRAFVAMAGAFRTVTVCDGLLFHGNLTDLLLMAAEPAMLVRYVEQVIETARPLTPAVIYLRQTDVSKALRTVSEQRGPAWVGYQVGWKIASPYAERRGLCGYDGLVSLYREYVALCLEILDRLDVPKLVVERDGNWQRACDEVREFLRLEEAAE